jgi:ParB family chromosome partitioning protein
VSPLRFLSTFNRSKGALSCRKPLPPSANTDGLQYDINSLAAKAGKSPSFIATRLRLVELLPSIAEAFLADQIGVGHALEIAKLPQDQQQKAFDAAFRMVWNGATQSRVIFPLRDFTAWIEQNILLSLDSVPFDKADAALVPEAGSCTECQSGQASISYSSEK